MKKDLRSSIEDFKSKHSTRELVMLVVLLVFALYFLAVPLPISKIGAKIDAKQIEVETKIAEDEEKLTMMPVMLAQINKYKTSGDEFITPATDNTKGVIRGYQDIIGEVDNYSLTFTGSEKSGKVIRKRMSLSFSVDSYNDAINKIEALETNRNGFLVSDCSISGGATGENNTEQVWNVSLTITEFEYKV